MAKITVVPVNSTPKSQSGSTKTAASITGARHNPDFVKVFS
jgi:hypothetical protein